MPTYSYRCTACDNAFDIQQAFTDDTLTVCPVCGGALRKVFSPVGVSFSGSGFYRTDSRAAEKSAPDKAAPGTGPKSDGPKSDGPKKDGPKKDAAKPAPAAAAASSASSSSSSSTGS